MNCRKGVLVQLTQYENEVWLVGEVLQTVAYGLPDVLRAKTPLRRELLRYAELSIRGVAGGRGFHH
jgi:hypothetical protein